MEAVYVKTSFPAESRVKSSSRVLSEPKVGIFLSETELTIPWWTMILYGSFRL